MALTKEQFKTLYDKGLSVEQITAFESGQTPDVIRKEQQGPGFFQTLVQSIASPALRTVSNIGAALESGNQENYDKIQKEGLDFGYLGKARPIGSMYNDKGEKQSFGRRVTDTLGTGLEASSYLVGGPAAKAAITTGLKGQLLRGAGEGLAIGAAGGGLVGAGVSMQKGDDFSSVAYNAMFGTLAGGAGGVVLGATTPLIAKSIRGVKTYSNISSIEKELVAANKNILKPTSAQIFDWEQKGVDPLKTFVNEFGPSAIPVVDDKFVLDEIIEQTNARYRAGAESFNTILRESPARVNLLDRGAIALADIEKSVLDSTAKKAAKIKIREKIQNDIEEATTKGFLSEDGTVPVAYADNIKDGYWAGTKNFGTEESSVSNAVNKSLGFAFKNGIEEVIEDVNVRNFNKKLQELIVLENFLISRNGKVPGTGGKMSRYIARMAGSVAGSGGGPVGSVTGIITADKIAQAISSPNTRTWILRKQLERLAPEERISLQKQAEEVLAKMAQKRAEILKLGPGDRALAPKGKVGSPIPSVINPESPTTYESAAQSINTQRILPLSASEITQPVTNANINKIITIPETIPPALGNASQGVDNMGISKVKSPAQQAIEDGLTEEQFVKGQGTPVYHGTNNTFTDFDSKKIGSRDSGWFGKGFYFAGTKGEAGTYGKNIMEARLTMKKPFIFSEFESKINKGSMNADTFYLSNIAKKYH